MPDRREITVIMGPTASGKTACAVRHAKAFDAEIVSADSMQIYRHMDIGTAKATEGERGGVPHHMIDIAEPDEAFSVADYKRAAERCIRDILARGRGVVVTGGTGLYISALVYNIRYAEFSTDQGIRAKLTARAEAYGVEALHGELARVDPEAAARIHIHDQKRVVRALEVFWTTGRTITEHARLSRTEPPEFDYRLYCLDVPRAALYERINARVDDMLARGLAEEARALYGAYGGDITAFKAIGYKEFAAYFNGECSLCETAEKIKLGTRRYAKRQLTWFRAMSGVKWVTPEYF